MINRQQKRLLALLALLAGLVLIVEILPRLYQSYSEELTALRLSWKRGEQYRALPEREPYWRERHQEMRLAQAADREKLLAGETANLVSARLQGELKRVAGANGVTISSMSLPEFSRSDDWLLIGQTISFQAPPDRFKAFIAGLAANSYYLPIIESNLRMGPAGLNCTLKIIGFSRLDGQNRETP